MKKTWVNKPSSFKKAGDFDDTYYFNLRASERLDIVQFLRENFSKIKGHPDNAGRKRLRRVVKIIQ